MDKKIISIKELEDIFNIDQKILLQYFQNLINTWLNEEKNCQLFLDPFKEILFDSTERLAPITNTTLFLSGKALGLLIREKILSSELCRLPRYPNETIGFEVIPDYYQKEIASLNLKPIEIIRHPSNYENVTPDFLTYNELKERFSRNGKPISTIENQCRERKLGLYLRVSSEYVSSSSVTQDAVQSLEYIRKANCGNPYYLKRYKGLEKLAVDSRRFEELFLHGEIKIRNAAFTSLELETTDFETKLHVKLHLLSLNGKNAIALNDLVFLNDDQNVYQEICSAKEVKNMHYAYHWLGHSETFETTEYERKIESGEWFDSPRKAYLHRYCVKQTIWPPIIAAYLLLNLEPKDSLANALIEVKNLYEFILASFASNEADELYCTNSINPTAKNSAYVNWAKAKNIPVPADLETKCVTNTNRELEENRIPPNIVVAPLSKETIITQPKDKEIQSNMYQKITEITNSLVQDASGNWIVTKEIQANVIEVILNAIKSIADNNFSVSKMPGQVYEFYELCTHLCPRIFSKKHTKSDQKTATTRFRECCKGKNIPNGKTLCAWPKTRTKPAPEFWEFIKSRLTTNSSYK